MLSPEEQEEISADRMDRYDRLPPDIQKLSRQYGHLVDRLWEYGCAKDDIIVQLKLLGRWEE